MLIIGLLAEKCHGFVITQSIARRPFSCTTNSTRLSSIHSAGAVTPAGPGNTFHYSLATGRFNDADFKIDQTGHLTTAAFLRSSSQSLYQIQVTSTDEHGLSLTKVFAITVIHVNHAPVGASGTVFGIAKAVYTFKASDFGFTDTNDAPANSLLGVKVTLLPGAGTLKNNGVLVTANQLISAANIIAGKLVFTPAPTEVGLRFLCKFQVEDNGGIANGGSNLDPTPKVLDINLVHVNHAPIGVGHIVLMSKNSTYVLKATDFGFSDPNETPPNTFLAVKLTTTTALGRLMDNGVKVVAGQRISLADIANGKLKFTPLTNGSGVAYASFTFQVQDNGGTANGGVDTDLMPRKMTISVI